MRRSLSPVGSPPARSAAETPPDVSVHIDRVVVEALPLSANQSSHLEVGLTSELSRLLEGEHLADLATRGRIPSLLAPSVKLPASPRPEELARVIARAVHDSLSHPTRGARA